jgi:hypothetical protein
VDEICWNRCWLGATYNRSSQRVRRTTTQIAVDHRGRYRISATSRRARRPNRLPCRDGGTGHYWKNLFAALSAEGFAVALLNPIRTRRFAEEELQRTKTDHVDALGIARFAAQKKPRTTPLSDQAREELRQLVHLRQQSVQHLGDRVRNLHRAVDLTFPEFTRYVRGLDTELATAILSRYPWALALSVVTVRKLASLCFDGRRRVGYPLARDLIAVGQVVCRQPANSTFRVGGPVRLQGHNRDAPENPPTRSGYPGSRRP